MLKFNLEQMGLKAEHRGRCRSPSRCAPWHARRRLRRLRRRLGRGLPDPFDFINVLLDGGNIQDANNSNYAYFNDAKFTKQMNDFAKLSGEPLHVVRQARRGPHAERGAVGALRDELA